MNPVPLSVVGGFLGVGKTTLVNHLLRTATRRWGVIVNDFGALNIDAALIDSADETLIALSNGCICCKAGPDLGAGLARLLAGKTPPEHVLIEASGVGDPWRIAQLALIEPGFTLEPLIVIVDAASFPGQLAESYSADTVKGQLAFADVIAINKCDLVSRNELEHTKRLVRTLRPQARLIETEAGRVPGDVLCFQTPHGAALSGSAFLADAPAHGFSTWHWQPAAALDADRLRQTLTALPRTVLRVKGFCLLGREARPHLLQYVGERWALTPCRNAPIGLVLIGTTEMPSPATLTTLFGQTLL